MYLILTFFIKINTKIHNYTTSSFLFKSTFVKTNETQIIIVSNTLNFFKNSTKRGLKSLSNYTKIILVFSLLQQKFTTLYPLIHNKALTLKKTLRVTNTIAPINPPSVAPFYSQNLPYTLCTHILLLRCFYHFVDFFTKTKRKLVMRLN